MPFFEHFLFLQGLQRTCRTSINALLTVLTVFCHIGRIKLRLDNRCKSSAHKAENTLADLLVTYTDAEVTENTLVLISFDRNELLLLGTVVLFTEEAFGLNVILICVSDQLTFMEVVTAALKTALRLVHRLFCGKAEIDLVEIMFSFFGTSLRHLCS